MFFSVLAIPCTAAVCLKSVISSFILHTHTHARTHARTHTHAHTQRKCISLVLEALLFSSVLAVLCTAVVCLESVISHVVLQTSRRKCLSFFGIKVVAIFQHPWNPTYNKNSLNSLVCWLCTTTIHLKGVISILILQTSQRKCLPLVLESFPFVSVLANLCTAKPPLCVDYV